MTMKYQATFSAAGVHERKGHSERAAASFSSPRLRKYWAPLSIVVVSVFLAFAVLALSTGYYRFTPSPSTVAPAAQRTSGISLCPNPTLRSDWRTLSNSQKLAYISAVQCLQRLPSISNNLQGANTRFDDFQAIHVVMADRVHRVGQFLPWHRRFLKLFEVALQDECGYQGGLPFYDWSPDIDNGGPLAKFPIFDAVYGFGGNGLDIPNYAGQFGNLSALASAGWVAPGAGGGCIVDGPFAAYNLSVGPGTSSTNHCLQRAFNDNIRQFLSSSMIKDVLRQTTYEAFRIELEGAPVTETMRLHDGGHNLVGGEIADHYSSPGDPVFYLHHAFVDKLWWDWVGLDFASRIDQISGRTAVVPPYTNVTLDFELDTMVVPVVAIREVMDIRNPLLCYTYG